MLTDQEFQGLIDRYHRDRVTSYTDRFGISLYLQLFFEWNPEVQRWVWDPKDWGPQL